MCLWLWHYMFMTMTWYAAFTTVTCCAVFMTIEWCAVFMTMTWCTVFMTMTWYAMRTGRGVVIWLWLLRTAGDWRVSKTDVTYSDRRPRWTSHCHWHQVLPLSELHAVVDGSGWVFWMRVCESLWEMYQFQWFTMHDLHKAQSEESLFNRSFFTRCVLVRRRFS